MTKPIISVRNITKSYRLYAKPVDRLKEALWPWKQRHTLFHALNDVSFDVYPGDYLGILGQNGAGKSTLLQILTGVLTPTAGTMEVNGRVAALLELGAGFNPELTGRENVIFQMQLAGIGKDAMPVKLAEVQSFADVGEFFDQPMKLYSSGMYARVAFSSAILTEPEILIVDEALAVGDARFQKKCLDRMNRMKEAGTTIILVTHDVFGAKAASDHMLLLDRGTLIADGHPEDVATQYLKLLFPNEAKNSSEGEETFGTVETLLRTTEDIDDYVHCIRPGSQDQVWGLGGAKLIEMRIKGLLPPDRLCGNTSLIIECDYRLDVDALIEIADSNAVSCNILVGMRFETVQGHVLTDFTNACTDEELFTIDVCQKSYFSCRFTIQLPELALGQYFLSPSMALGTRKQYISIFSYDNLAIITYEPWRTVLGLFRTGYKIDVL